MEKSNKRYLSLAGAVILLGGIGVVSSNAFATGNTTPTSTVSTPLAAPSVSIPSTDTLESGDSVDAPAVTDTMDTPEVGDTVDASAITDTVDTPEVGDTVDASAVTDTTGTPEAGDTVDSGN